MTRIAFASCANIELRSHGQIAWAQMADATPELLLLLGDTTYMNWDDPLPGETGWEPERLAANYARQFDVPDFQHLLQAQPTLAIWDDHDLGPNDSCGGEMPAEQVAFSRALFDRYLHMAINANKPQMYCSHDIGPVRVIMLDVRTHRTHSNGNLPPTVLGDAQEGWLWHQLATNTQPYTVIASGSVTDRGIDGHKFRDYPVFYQRLLQELRHGGKTGADGRPRKVLFLSGDIHDNRWRPQAGFFEATSSGVACIAPRNGPPIDNWGLLEFDTTADEVRIHLRGRAPSYTRTHRVQLSSWQELL